jgi:hypothetical protein
MNSTSRTPRPLVVDRKILHRRKPAKRKSTPPGDGSSLNGASHKKEKPDPFSEADRLDCEGLKRYIDLLNVGKTNRDPEWISPATLARFAAPFGGSKHRQHWEDCLKMRRAVSHANKLIVTLFFAQFPQTQHLRTQDIFPSWRFSKLTPFPAAARIPAFVFLLMVQAPNEQEEFSRLSEVYLAANREQRRSITQAAHALLGAPIAK